MDMNAYSAFSSSSVFRYAAHFDALTVFELAEDGWMCSIDEFSREPSGPDATCGNSLLGALGVSNSIALARSVKGCGASDDVDGSTPLVRNSCVMTVGTCFDVCFQVIPTPVSRASKCRRFDEFSSLSSCLVSLTSTSSSGHPCSSVLEVYARVLGFRLSFDCTASAARLPRFARATCGSSNTKSSSFKVSSVCARAHLSSSSVGA